MYWHEKLLVALVVMCLINLEQLFAMECSALPHQRELRGGQVLVCRCSDSMSYAPLHPSNVNALEISNCSKFAISFTGPVRLVSIGRRSIDVVTTDDSLSNISPNTTIAAIHTEKWPERSDSLYFLLSIGLAALLIASWLVFIVVTLICLLKRRKLSSCCACGSAGRRRKTVSRANSWRYESNIYVNPSHRQQRPMTKPEPQEEGMRFYTSPAFQQMLPCQLLPHKQAAMLVHSQQGASGLQQPLLLRQEHLMNPIVHGHANMVRSNVAATMKSFPDADTTDTEDMDADDMSKRSDTYSRYNSRNRKETLPVTRAFLQAS